MIIITPDNRVLGDAEQDLDGYYYWWPRMPGAYPEHALLFVAEHLARLNRAWDNEVHDLLSNQLTLPFYDSCRSNHSPPPSAN